MEIIKNLKQFLFASVLFLTGISIHMNYVMIQNNAQALLDQSEQKIENIQVTKEAYAYNSMKDKLNL